MTWAKLILNHNQPVCGIIGLVLTALMLSGCYPATECVIAPSIDLIPQQRNVDCLPSAFDRLTPQELENDWGKELLIAEIFAKEFDLYRAITSYKRAEILIPKNHPRLQQIQYSIIESYYLGQKYQDVIDTFEKSSLLEARPDFPAFGQLLIILKDAYQKLGLEEKACRMLSIIEQGNDEVAYKLKMYEAIKTANFCEAQDLGGAEEFLMNYGLQTKSVAKARRLNAILPGAGYYYVGQKKSAVTSFLINTLFIAAAYQFFDRGYYAAGAITTSLELGWYLGGINGAGIEANEYNERLYETHAKNFLIKQGMFPILMFETSF